MKTLHPVLLSGVLGVWKASAELLAGDAGLQLPGAVCARTQALAVTGMLASMLLSLIKLQNPVFLQAAGLDFS